MGCFFCWFHRNRRRAMAACSARTRRFFIWLHILSWTCGEADPWQTFPWGGSKAWFKVDFEQQYLASCLESWQDQCRKRESDEEIRNLVCESHLGRGYLKARLLVERSRVQAVLDYGPEKYSRDQIVAHQMLRFPIFTSTGLARRRVPADIHGDLLHKFREHRHLAMPESEAGSSPVAGIWCNNGYDNDDYVLPMQQYAPASMRKLVDFARHELERWSGQKISEPAIAYGARLYHRGSICGMHVDNADTHVLSAIYHLDDHGINSPWPLSGLTHNGQEERIVPDVGELTLYESASVPHGRKTPFDGAEYVNVFIHFRPTGWLETKEQLRPTPANRPKQGPDFKRRRQEALRIMKEPQSRPAGSDCLPQGVGHDHSAAAHSMLMEVPGSRSQLNPDSRSEVDPGGFQDDLLYKASSLFFVFVGLFLLTRFLGQRRHKPIDADK